MLLDASCVELENRRRPGRLEALADALKGLSLVLHVHSCRQEILIDEAHDALIRPHLGIQPSTATSHRRGAEIQKNRPILRLRVVEHLLYVMTEIDLHIYSPFVPTPAHRNSPVS